MVRGRSKTFKYKYMNYNEEVKMLIDCELNNTEINELDNIYKNFKKLHVSRGYEYIIKDLYILVKKFNVSTNSLAYIYDVSSRSIQIWLKELDIKRKKNSNQKDLNCYTLNKSTKIQKTELIKHCNKTAYSSITYNNEIRKDLDTIKLSKEELIHLNKLIEIHANAKYNCIIEDIFKFHKLNYTPEDLSKIFNKSIRTFQLIFKELGLNRNRFEAQEIAKNKRDYCKIRKKFKETMLSKNFETQLKGSQIEEYTRYKINLNLQNLFYNKINEDVEIIVGINTLGIINLETDIPIIIIKSNKIFKYIVEVDGFFTHKFNLNDIIKNHRRKDDLAKEKNYTLLRINTKAYFDEEKKLIFKNNLDTEISKVCEYIIKDIK